MAKKKFTILCTVPVYYNVHIEADSKEEAEKLFRDTEGDYSIFDNYEDHGEIEISDILEEPDKHWYEINYTVPVYCRAVIPAVSEEEALEKFNKEHDYAEDTVDRGAPKITEIKKCDNAGKMRRNNYENL